jgi:hypothetical protein
MAVNVLKAVFGTSMLILSAIICYQYFRILRNVYHHEEVALTMFFLDDRGPHAFKLLTAVSLVFLVGSSIIVIGTLYNWSFGILFHMFGEQITTSTILFTVLPKVATLLALGGIIYFQHLVHGITTPPAEQAEEKS